MATYMQEYYQQNKEDLKADAKKYRDSHKEEISLAKEEYYQQNKEEILEKRSKDWHSQSPEEKAKKALYFKEWRQRNKEKLRQQKKEYVKNNEESIYFKRILKTYGLTKEKYEEILKNQMGGCAICGKQVNAKGKKRLHIDHDHQTGKIRGLLCHLHNTMIGQGGDVLEELEKAIQYLKTHNNHEK